MPLIYLCLIERLITAGNIIHLYARIVLPWRTFFMEAPTEQNKREWMEILRWKVVSVHYHFAYNYWVLG